jgi:predicted DNA-binding transcriptional regulator YafY
MASYIGNPNIYTFALDRMLHLENDAETPYEPTDVDFEHYFDDIIGVTNYQDKPVEHIEIWVKNKELPYVLSKPLHRSQQLLQKDVNGGALITIDVKRNTELKQAILSYGGFMEVMKPLDLRKELDEQASLMRQVYDTPEPG